MSANQTVLNAEDLVAQVDTGARNPLGRQKYIIPIVCFSWALYQLYIASELPFILTSLTGIDFFQFIGNLSISRKIHLAFSIGLATLAFPLLKISSRKSIPWYDWVLIGCGVFAMLYMIAMNTNIANRAGDFSHANIRYDMTVALIGMVVLTVAVYRAIGLPLVVVAAVLAGYVYIGGGNWGGASFVKGMWHFWMQEEGVFGKPLAVSTQTIFLFVLFGAILEKSGAGGYFIKIAFALLGHYKGGPAKAAVIASALSGLYSGSSIANTVTTGTFTIPLMKRTGFSAEKAGAVEVASSTNGQLMPPVMGAAAFLIAEFTGVDYTTLLKHALLPALVSYIALVYIVHIEACKLNLKGLPKHPSTKTFINKLIGFLGGFITISLMFLLVYFTLGWVKANFPSLSVFTVMTISLLIYLVLIYIASKRPDLEKDDPEAPITELPIASETAWTGLYFLLPIILLLWCILPTPERLSAHISAYYACLAMMFISLTQHPLKALFRGESKMLQEFKKGASECIDGIISGSRNMISIGIATAAAGVIVGSISLTGAHGIIGEFVEYLSGGNLMIMLILVAIMSLILGMGLPTTANYLVVAGLMAPVIIALGAKSGLIVPLVAVHLFVFYFGILADDTPPVGLAAYAAAAISKGDPIKTGIQGFAYDIRTAVLPFMFLFNTELLLMNVTFFKAIFVFIIATVAMMLFAAATQGWFMFKSRKWESVALLLIAFTLFRPGYWLDQISPEFTEKSGAQALLLAEALPADAQLRVRITGPDFDDYETQNNTSIILKLGPKADGETRLTNAGLQIMQEDGKVVIDALTWDSKHKHLDQVFTFGELDDPVMIDTVLMVNQRFAKELFYIPALLLLALIIFLQLGREKQHKLEVQQA
ncbi:MAG: TRAP transporter permease [Pseudomonadales bacterium]|nr:TRAP transporter permease [Pseudomonadales bacterium]NRA18013.1 TRAP transporter permease [Oceanospirillaceae bacterium]